MTDTKLNDKIKYAIISGLVFLLFATINLAGTGHSSDFSRYIIAVLFGSVAGFIVGWIKETWRQEKKQLEQEIACQNEEIERSVFQRKGFTAVLNNIAEGVISTDDRGKVTSMNAIAGQLTGWNPQEAGGRSIADIFKVINEEMGQSCENPVARALCEKQVICSSDNTTLVTKNSSIAKVAYHVSLLFGKKRKIIGAVLVFQTIAGKERAKTEFRKIRPVETQGILTRVIAHDFNNILTVILGKINLARTLVARDSKTYKLLESAEDASFRATDLTQRLLDLTHDSAAVEKDAAIRESQVD